MRPTSLAVLMLLAGCVGTTRPAVNPHFTLRPETRPECTARCSEMGMRLGAVVLIENSAGCVCEPEDRVSSATRAAAVVSAELVVSAAEEKARAEQQRQDEEKQRREDEERERRRREEELRPAPAVPPS